MNDSFQMAPFMPFYIKNAFKDFDLKLELDVWSPFEIKALDKLLNSKKMIDVYDAISRYQLTSQMWRDLIILGFCHSYSYIKEDRDIIHDFFESLDDSFFPILSKDIYNLYCTLHSQEMDYFSYSYDELHEEISECAYELEKQLFKLLRLTTSLKWPENQYKSITENSLDLSWHDKNVVKLRAEESPELVSDNKKIRDNYAFPPPLRKYENAKKAKYPYKRFIINALERIGDICEKQNRQKIRFIRSGNIIIPSSFNYIYIADKHWSTICELLFDLKQNEITQIDKTQKPYRKRAGITDVKVRKPS